MNVSSRRAPQTNDASCIDRSSAMNGPSSNRYSAAVAPITLTPIIPYHDWILIGVPPNRPEISLLSSPTGYWPSIAQLKVKNSGGIVNTSTIIGVTSRRSGVRVRVTVQAR
jgi:hypothetical protein